MVRKKRGEEEVKAPEALPLPEERKQLKRYFAGKRLPSPMGGYLELVRVRRDEGGSATALFECNTSSLRFQLAIPKASRTERQRLKEMQEAGEEATCPRHGPTQRLVRAGPDMLCPLCGVPYGKTS